MVYLLTVSFFLSGKFLASHEHNAFQSGISTVHRNTCIEVLIEVFIASSIQVPNDTHEQPPCCTCRPLHFHNNPNFFPLFISLFHTVPKWGNVFIVLILPHNIYKSFSTKIYLMINALFLKWHIFVLHTYQRLYCKIKVSVTTSKMSTNATWSDLIAVIYFLFIVPEHFTSWFTAFILIVTNRNRIYFCLSWQCVCHKSGRVSCAVRSFAVKVLLSA